MLLEAKAPATMTSETADRLYVRRYGEGERIFVGLHGWNGTHRTFAPLAPHLPDDTSILAVDLPGYGRSPTPAEWTLDAVADSLIAGLDAHGVGRFSIVGSCSGAVVGLYLARTAGGRLQEFHLLEPFAFIPWYLRLLLVPILGRLFYRSSFGTRAGRWVTNAVLADQRDSETNMMEAFARTRIDVPYRYLQLFDRIESAEVFAGIPGRKFLVRAERTFDAVRDSVDRWEAAWPDATRVTIGGAGHLLIDEATEKLADALFGR